MPGKNSQSSNKGKQDYSRDRLTSANTSEGGSKKVSIWPEWTDAELATEKWDLGGGGTGKGRDKGKSVHTTVVHDDPDAVLLPASLADPNSVVWKRPTDENIADIFNKAAPVIVSNPESPSLDLWSCNKHLFHCQLMCWIVGQLNVLWQMRHSLGVDVGGAVEGDRESSLAWRPWEHIQPHPKGSPAPQINLTGKYCIRLYWMGCWRKITIDDKLPFLERAIRVDSGKIHVPAAEKGIKRGESSKLERGAEKGGRTSVSTREGSEDVELTALFPRTTVLNELWPALLMKAILKVVALDYTEGCADDEFGDSSVIHMLTGWTPYTIPLMPSSAAVDTDTWTLLQEMLPLWLRPPEAASDDSSIVAEVQGEESTVERPTSGTTRPLSPTRVAIPPRRKCIVVASFKSNFPGPPPYKPLTTTPALVEVSKTETLLKRFSVIPSDYNLTAKPSFPVLLTRVRNQLLHPPPKEPPLPELQAPYYLGLQFRQPHPGCPTPPPTPPPVEPRFLELLPTIADYNAPGAQPLLMDLSCNSVVISDNSLNKAHVPSDTSTAKVADKPSKLTATSRLGVSLAKPAVSEKTIKGKEPPAVKEYVPEYVHAKRWMEYCEFMSAFSNICIFKNPYEFKHRDIYSDVSKTMTTSTARAATASSSRKGVSNVHLSSSSKSHAAARDHNCLLVDSVEPVEFLFVFSSLSNWREGGKDTHRCYLSAPIKNNRSRAFSPYRPSVSISVVSDQQVPTTPSSTPDQGQRTEPASAGSKGLAVDEGRSTPGPEQEGRRGRNKILSGSLVVETYSWRSVQFGDPVLQMATTGVKGALFAVPPGRHLWKLHVKAPIGHHLEIFSNSSFTLASEDSMFAYLSQDCGRFVDYSTKMAKVLLSSSSDFGNTEALEDSLEPLVNMLLQCDLTSGHAKILLSSALHSWFTRAKEYELSTKTQTAWKAFLCKVFSLVAEKLPAGTCSIEGEVSDIRNKLKVQFVKEGSIEKPEVPEMWCSRQPTPQEDGAARVISSSLRQYTKSRLEDIMVPGSAANREAITLLKLSLKTFKSLASKLGSIMLYGMFKLDPLLVEQFPFCEDMRHQAYSAIYCGSFPPIQPNSWTIVLRKTFHVSEPQLVAFYFHCPLPSSMLRVIDNDTMTEIPRVFQTTVPYTYQPNSNGYTLQAEAWSTVMATSLQPPEDTEDKKWKLRLATSSCNRPPVLEGVTGEEEVAVIDDSFHKQEVMDYCLPDREEILFRYHVIPAKKSEISVQVTTSKPDVLLGFEILDNGSAIAADEGRGVCTVPLCPLQPVGKGPSIVEDTATEGVQEPQITHKYVLQGRILRKSWPLSETAWPQIAILHRQEDQGSGHKPGSGKKSKGKDKKKAGATIQPQPTPVQPQIDVSKPHWVLRVVTKGSSDESVELKKDTDRADQLKSMVQAWEAEQPGRCKQAQESRQKFLEARAIREEKGAEDELTSTSTLEGTPVSVPRPNVGPVKIWQMDLTPFIIKESDTPILLDEAEQARRLEERQKLFKEYRNSRQAVLELRNEDRQRRNEAKVKQVELAEQWQAELDALRKKLNAVRESIREKHLAKEKAEVERLHLQEEMQSPMGGRDSKTKAKGKKKK